MFDRAEHCRRIASLGGKAHSREHMSEIGKRGFVALAMRLGDNGAAVSYLQKHRSMAKKPRSQWSRNRQWNAE